MVFVVLERTVLIAHRIVETVVGMVVVIVPMGRRVQHVPVIVETV